MIFQKKRTPDNIRLNRTRALAEFLVEDEIDELEEIPPTQLPVPQELRSKKAAPAKKKVSGPTKKKPTAPTKKRTTAIAKKPPAKKATPKKTAAKRSVSQKMVATTTPAVEKRPEAQQTVPPPPTAAAAPLERGGNTKDVLSKQKQENIASSFIIGLQNKGISEELRKTQRYLKTFLLLLL